MDLNQLVSDIQTLDASDLQRIGIAPPAVKAILIGIASLIVIALGAWFYVQPSNEELDAVAAKEMQLRMKYSSEQGKAANREAYIAQLDEMKKAFKVMLRQLPNATDIESLLVDLSQTSVASGLTVEHFKPDNEILKEFYAEYPIKISVTGNYHEFGTFISGLSALPRIVTLGDIEITQKNTARGGSNSTRKVAAYANDLTMKLTATTYRYIEDE